MPKRGDVCKDIPVKNPTTGKIEDHLVVVVQDLGVDTCKQVLVCTVSTKQDPAIHRRLKGWGLLGVLEEQEHIERESRLWLHRMFLYKRATLDKKRVGTLTAGNMAILDKLTKRLFGLPL